MDRRVQGLNLFLEFRPSCPLPVQITLQVGKVLQDTFFIGLKLLKEFGMH